MRRHLKGQKTSVDEGGLGPFVVVGLCPNSGLLLAEDGDDDPSILLILYA